MDMPKEALAELKAEKETAKCDKYSSAMKAAAKNCESAISDLEVFRWAVRFNG